MGHLAIPLRPLRRIGGCQALCLGFGRAHLPASSFSRNKLVPNPPRRLSLSRPPLPSLPLLIVISSCRWEEESDINGKKTEHSKSICGRHRPYLRLRRAPLAFFYFARIEPDFCGRESICFSMSNAKIEKSKAITANFTSSPQPFWSALLAGAAASLGQRRLHDRCKRGGRTN